MHRSIVIVLATVVFGAGAARASDADVSWQAPPGCPNRESLRQSLAKRLGREVIFGRDASLKIFGEIAARGDGYVLELQTRSQTQSEARRLTAHSCNELARASLLIAALLISAAPEPDATPAAPARDEASDEPAARMPEPAARDWFVLARALMIGDVGSLASPSLGPGIALGIGFQSTRFEIGALYLPRQEIAAHRPREALANLQLMAASAAVCHELSRGPAFSPCLRLETGRLRGQGQQRLAQSRTADSLWLVSALGARLTVQLFERLYWLAEASAGVPWSRPTFAVEGLGELHRVPAVLARLEMSVEGRF